MLEVSANDQNGKEIFMETREFMNVGISGKGEPATAAWLISSYSKDKSTAIRAHETETENFTIPVSGKGMKSVVVHARIISHHGLPVEFGKPAAGKVVLEKSRTVVLGRQRTQEPQRP